VHNKVFEKMTEVADKGDERNKEGGNNNGNEARAADELTQEEHFDNHP